MVVITLWICLSLLNLIVGQSLTNGIHRTPAAMEKINDLMCYSCDTMDDGESCVDIHGRNNSSTSLIRKCKAEEFVCMVKRFSFTTSTENSTSSPKMWSLKRNCAVKCESGCIVIGERTKLYACTSCCEKSLCNVGRGCAKQLGLNNTTLYLLLPILLAKLISLYYKGYTM